MRKALLAIATLTGLVTAPLPVGAEEETTEATASGDVCASCEALMELALSNKRRDSDRARDIYRHPAETLSFFRIRPGMTVVDVMPSNGWFAKILVPYLGPDGHYIGLNPEVSDFDERGRNFLGNLKATFPANVAEWTGVPAASIGAYNSDQLPASLNGTVDRVMVMREVHNIVRYPNNGMGREFGRIRALLKPDGLLGIEEHRAKPGAPDAYVDGSKGYMREADVIRLIEAQGFQLVAQSEINANPKDPADWPNGVWTLPPSYALKDQDRAKYTAVGESDRMTLLFRKAS